MSWFSDQRMEWITETLRVFGHINRKHLMRKFAISEPQAVIDLREYRKRFPGTMEYDAHRKTYVPTQT